MVFTSGDFLNPYPFLLQIIALLVIVDSVRNNNGVVDCLWNPLNR